LQLLLSLLKMWHGNQFLLKKKNPYQACFMFTGRRVWQIQVYDNQEIARFGDCCQEGIWIVNNVEHYKEGF
jgi:hypothetical protein